MGPPRTSRRPLFNAAMNSHAADYVATAAETTAANHDLLKQTLGFFFSWGLTATAFLTSAIQILQVVALILSVLVSVTTLRTWVKANYRK